MAVGAGTFVPIAVGVGATLVGVGAAFVGLDTGVFVGAETIVAVAAIVGWVEVVLIQFLEPESVKVFPGSGMNCQS